MGYTAIIILNYNNYSDTINCIDSVLEYNTAKIKFLVVDNGSPDRRCVPILDRNFSNKFSNTYLRINDGDKVTEKFPLMTFIVSKTNDGYARGNNKALKYIHIDNEIKYVLILNNDILFIQDIIPELILHLHTLRDAAIVSPLLLKRDGKTIDYNCARKNVSMTDIIVQNLRTTVRMRWKSNKKFFILKMDPTKLDTVCVEIELPSGSCMLIEKDLFFRINCFDPNTFLYYEENILYKKVSIVNKQNYLIPDLKCIHLGAQSTSKRPKSFHAFMEANRSQIYYVKKYSGANIFYKFIYVISLGLSCLSRFIFAILKRYLSVQNRHTTKASS